MPNHVENDLYISGPKDKVAELIAFIGADKETPEFDFSAVIPYPAEYAQRDEDARTMDHEAFQAKYGNRYDGFNSGGYEWSVRKWGTKWNAYDVKRRDYEGFCLTFQTAWSPPLPVIAAMHKRFPECSITLEFFERGMAFSGGVSYLQSAYADDEEGWEPGKPSQEWHHNDYRGTRGGQPKGAQR